MRPMMEVYSMTEIKNKVELSSEEKKMCTSLFWRTMTLSCSWNYETQQALGFTYAMIPVIKTFYKDPEKQKKALARHNELFNTTPTMGGIITGLVASMEKEASQNEDFDTTSISALKLSLMGPFAGIGDSIFWGTLRVISLGIGIALAATGNFFGPIIHLLVYNIPAHFLRYNGVFKSYELGQNFMKRLSENGLFSSVTRFAGIIGMTTVGAMACTMTNFRLDKAFTINGTSFVLQSIVDSVCPTALGLLLTYWCFRQLKKGTNPSLLMVILLVFGIALKMAGLV